MRSFAALRLAAQLLLVSAVLCLLGPFRADWPLFALLPALALLAALAALPLKAAPARLALGLLPALALPLASGLPALIAGGLMTGYCAAFLSVGRFALELWQYRREAVVLIALAAVTALLSNLAAFRGVPPRWLALACGVCALLALRALRMARAASPAWEAAGAGLFLLLPLGGAAAGAAIWAATPLLQYPLRAIGALLGGAAALWSSFWAWLLGSVDSIGDDFFVEESGPVPTLPTQPAMEPGAELPGSSNLRMPELNIPWLTLLAVAAGVALLILALRLLRRGRRAPAANASSDYQWETAPEPSRRPRSRKRSRRGPRTNRDRVRTLYKDYLDFLSGCGVRPAHSETTAEISADAAAVLNETDELLRALYRQARYSDAPITDAELRDAEAQLARLTREENLRSAQTGGAEVASVQTEHTSHEAESR